MSQKYSWMIVVLVSINSLIIPGAEAKNLGLANRESVQPQKKIAQSQISFNCLQLTYSVAGVVHTSVLGMPAGSSIGVMVTDFYDGNLGRQSRVEQTMSATNSPEGLLIVGSDPVYPGTSRSYSTYSPDNFLMRVLPTGDVAAVNCDDNSVCTEVRVAAC